MTREYKGNSNSPSRCCSADTDYFSVAAEPTGATAAVCGCR